MHIFYTTPTGISKEFTTESNTVIIGRLVSNQPDYLSLKDGKVSAHHARLTCENGVYWIEDLGSTNGTWVNKKRITAKTMLTEGAMVRVGETKLKIEMAPLSASPPSCDAEPLSVDKPVEVVLASEPLPDLYLTNASLDIVRSRLSVVCELSASLGTLDTFEALASTLLDHLNKAFPRMGRDAHSGLLLGSDLVLKAYRPENRPPTCSLTLARYVIAQKRACLWQVNAPEEIKTSVSLFQHGTQSAMYAPLIWKDEALGVVYIDASSTKAPFDKEDLQLMQAIATQAAMFIKNLSLQQTLQREAIVKARLLAQFPRQIAERLSRQPGRMAIVSERVESITALLSDVRGFTKLSSIMEPEQVVQMLNDMFYDLTPIVLKYNGTVDKYVGDAILAVFGSPDPDELQWDHAVQAALKMQSAIKQLASERWQGRSPFQIGIGIHTGPAIHGFIGAPERMEYTVIGSTINCASRYCDAAAPGEVLISPAVFERLHQRVEVLHPPREIETKHEGKLKAYVVRSWKGKTGV